MGNDVFRIRRPLEAAGGESFECYSLPELESGGFEGVSRLPVSLRIVLESIVRNCDGKQVTEEHVKELCGWRPNGTRTSEIPFKVGRVVLQDFTGVPLLADLGAMRNAAAERGEDPGRIEPLVPVDLVIDHSVQVDHYASLEALRLNMEIEFERNYERYRFLKWGMNAFKTFKVVPPGVGIVHQVNLEYLAQSVMNADGVAYPDSLVGTDSHTTMINGVGVVGWGVGGIEAEAAMLGQPVNFLTPDVIGVQLNGQMPPGTTATDLVLTVTEMLRRESVVGKFVEFFGEGTRTLSVPDRATISNMAPEYGATMGYFPVDEKTIEYFRATGRSERQVALIESYYRSQGLFGIPGEGDCDYTKTLELDLGGIVPSVAGPKRPQDRIELRGLKPRFVELHSSDPAKGGYGKSKEDLGSRFPVEGKDFDVGDGDILIAAITSCTNTSNPSVLLAAGLLSRKAVEKGLKVHPRVKTSFAPGSRVVTDYLTQSNLIQPMQVLGFHVVGYGCTTCIGNSGPLDAMVEQALNENDLVGVSVLSGNRNFEARVHQSIRANFLMSPPLVVAFAIAGRIDVDFETDPLGTGSDGIPVFLKDVWPAADEIADVMHTAVDPDNYHRRYSGASGIDLPLWDNIASGKEAIYGWDAESTYIQKPPFLELQGGRSGDIEGARALAIFGDTVTTDHISPAGAIKPSSPAGEYLQAKGVKIADFNSYGSRRGNHEVMLRGTFANVRIRNLMAPGTEGGVTIVQPEGDNTTIYNAAMRYQQRGTPLIVFAGAEYGTGSSRDWAAKGTRLLGVRAVIAKSFERIHRSNLVGMGVLPFQFKEGSGADSLGLVGDETFSVKLPSGIEPQGEAELVIRRSDGSVDSEPLTLRVDTHSETEYIAHDGILPHVLSRLFEKETVA